MEKVQKSLRLHLALLGKVNSGKSSFLNLVTGQDVAITSEIAGTTTDVVEKNQELPPLGPVVWMDTAGLGDETELGRQRMERTMRVLDKTDVAVLVCEGNRIGEEEQRLIEEVERRKLPLIKIFNKADTMPCDGEGIAVSSLDKSSRDEVLNRLKRELIKKAPEEIINTPTLIGDLVSPGAHVVLITPIDDQAPKARILPLQVHVIRDCLDHNCSVTAVKETEYAAYLQKLKTLPDLVIADSSVVDLMVKETPAQVKCTTFSILFARLKGDLQKLAEGAQAISKLKNGDRVLIAESCTHHAAKNDIGTVKIPNLLRKQTGAELSFTHVAGCDFPADLQDYKLVVQCGGCMTSRREILSRINRCESLGVPITNYGICISALKGVLDKVIAPFELDKLR